VFIEQTLRHQVLADPQPCGFEPTRPQLPLAK